MMKKKHYKIGKYKCRTYFKTVGLGYEVGFFLGTRKIFVGNFIHSKEANTYWTQLNNEIQNFGKKYWISPKASVNWYSKFFTRHLYTSYYKFVNKHLTRHTREYTTALKKDQLKYKQLKKNWTPKDKVVFKRAA